MNRPELTTMEAPKARIHLNAEDLPAIKNWKVGSTYTIKLKVKQVGAHQDTYGDKKMHRAEFEVLSAKDGSEKKEYSPDAIKKVSGY